MSYYRWKLLPLKPKPFSPVHKALKFCLRTNQHDRETRADPRFSPNASSYIMPDVCPVQAPSICWDEVCWPTEDLLTLTPQPRPTLIPARLSCLPGHPLSQSLAHLDGLGDHIFPEARHNPPGRLAPDRNVQKDLGVD